MTTKELFEALLAGKKMKSDTWSDDHYVFLDKNGRLLTNDGTLVTFGSEVGNWDEYKESILTKKEKAYLSAVIKPFRDKIRCIAKRECRNSEEEFIYFGLYDGSYIYFPNFDKGTMYKGMEFDTDYTLEELGL